MRKAIAVIAAVCLVVVTSVEGRAQFSRLRFGDYGVKSISPESFSAVKGVVWLEVTNPMEGFTVSEISGMVYKDDAPFITGNADDFSVHPGTAKVVISGRAALCPGVSLWAVLGLIFFDPDDYYVDMSARITMDSGATRVVEKKAMPVRTLLKLM